jgi:hypothetical protein
MVSQVKKSPAVASIPEPSVGSIRNMTARIRNQWSPDEKQDRRHLAYLFQQQLLQACGLAANQDLEDVITVAR